MNRIHDLSHTLDENTYHPFGLPFFRNVQAFRSHGFRHAFLTMSLHFGTHMDAPWHMIEDGKRLDQISMGELAGDAVVVDVSENYGPDRASGKGISEADLRQALGAAGLELRRGDALIIHTGWAGLFSADPIRYYRDYCTLGSDASGWLAGIGVRLVGLDAPDVDLPERYASHPYRPENHRTLLGRGIYVIENVGGAIADVLNRRVDLIPAPLPLGGEFASGAPIRLLALEQEPDQERDREWEVRPAP